MGICHHLGTSTKKQDGYNHGAQVTRSPSARRAPAETNHQNQDYGNGEEGEQEGHRNLGLKNFDGWSG